MEIGGIGKEQQKEAMPPLHSFVDGSVDDGGGFCLFFVFTSWDESINR